MDRLEDDAKPTDAIMASDDVDTLVRYVARVGLTEAMDGYDVDVDVLAAAFVELGLFKAPPMQPSAPA